MLVEDSQIGRGACPAGGGLEDAPARRERGVTGRAPRYVPTIRHAWTSFTQRTY